MDNKEMRKEFEIWAKENYDLMNIPASKVERMFELFEDRYNFIDVGVGYQVFKKLKEESSAEKPINNEDELESLYWEFDDQRSKKTTDERLLFKGKLRYYASIVKNNVETTKPIWTWEDKIAGRLPEVGATVLGSLDCECVILGADIKDKIVAVQYQDGQLQKLNIHYINPVETPQEKYNREMEEYVKAIADKDPESRYSIYDFKEGVKAAYKQFKPFQEDKED